MRSRGGNRTQIRGVLLISQPSRVFSTYSHRSQLSAALKTCACKCDFSGPTAVAHSLCVSQQSCGFPPFFPQGFSLSLLKPWWREHQSLLQFLAQSNNPEIPINTDRSLEEPYVPSWSPLPQTQANGKPKRWWLHSGGGEMVMETHSKNSASHVWHNVRAGKCEEPWGLFF